MKFTWDNIDIVDQKYDYSEYKVPQPNFQQGWVCPKCGRVNAPWKGTCPCYMNKVQITCASFN